MFVQSCKNKKFLDNNFILICFDLVGHYCPRGTLSPTQFPCEEGTWTNLTNLISQEECYICPKGYFCLRGVSVPSGLCFTGHYCTRGMFKLLPVLPNRWCPWEKFSNGCHKTKRLKKIVSHENKCCFWQIFVDGLVKFPIFFYPIKE